ncbi:helix-turn-helix domain-containing protein, partial [Rhizobium leguminosarum]|uniref:helix-turn-helix domain-containing protein n=1 Tax=Rhizobium leguminosarum TaxID=384 RepID=UPI003F95ABAD
MGVYFFCFSPSFQHVDDLGTQQPHLIEPGMKRSKWKLFRAICEARQALGVTDRALTVLDALLTFYPDDEISEEKGLIVF